MYQHYSLPFRSALSFRNPYLTTLTMKFTLFTKVFTCIFLLSLLTASCESKKKDSETVDTKAPQIPQIYLDSLSIAAKDFSDVLPDNKFKNITFNYFLADTAVTLRGWVNKRTKIDSTDKDTSQFNPTPDLSLKPMGRSAIVIGPQTYLGNQVLYRRDLKKIMKYIAGKNVILYFIPKKDATGRIFYTIVFYDKIRQMILVDLPSFDTNPSPPHKSYD